jgi:putative flippase GtrA
VGDSGYRNVTSHPTVVRLYRFGIVGASAALVQTAVLWVLVDLGKINYIFAAVGAIELTIILQYVANNAWTFQHSRYAAPYDYLVGLLRTNVVRGSAIPIQVALLWAFVNWTGLMYLVANGLAIVISGIYRYYLDSRWTWQIP